MRAPISVVIPTLNAQASLPGCLAALMEGLDAGVIRELIITDGGSTDATLQIAEEVGAEIVHGDASRGGQLKRGCAAAKGDWLLIMHADSWLETGWTEAIKAVMPERAAGYFQLSFRAGGLMPRLVAGWANLRSRWFLLPYGDQGLLLSRALYEDVGGYRDQPLMEDVAISRALGKYLKPIKTRVFTGAERYVAEGWFRRGARNLRVLVAYLAGADPEKLVSIYTKSARR